MAQGGTAISPVFTVRNDGFAALTLGAAPVPAGYTLTQDLSASLTARTSDMSMVRLDSAVVENQSEVSSFSMNESEENPFNPRITGQVT